MLKDPKFSQEISSLPSALCIEMTASQQGCFHICVMLTTIFDPDSGDTEQKMSKTKIIREN